MEYRVKQIGNWYYPQYKGWFFWNTIRTKRLNAQFLMVWCDDRKVSLKAALKSIEEHKNKDNKVIIHKVEQKC